MSLDINVKNKGTSKTARPLLAYYYDEQATRLLPTDPLGNAKVMFDSNARPRAGVDSIHTSFYVKNVHHFPMELVPNTTDADLTITEYPEFLEPNETGKVTLTFSPSEDRITPLTGGCWDFTKVIFSRQ